MKKCVLTILATLICLFLFARDISSTSASGNFNWGYPSTWIGGIVPNAADNVIVNCNIVLNQYSNPACNHLVNNGTIQNNANISGSLTINGNLEINGTINNAGNTWNLTVYLAGDLANYGTIQISEVYINGTQNQDIVNVGTISVGNFYLVSEIGAAAWYFNGNLLGNGAQIAINVANLGVWHPISATETGRLITISNIATFLSVPENVSSYLSGSELKLRWNQVPGALHYNVYYAEYPEGPFTTLLSQVFDNDLSDGFVSADLSGSEPHRFYQVKAGN